MNLKIAVLSGDGIGPEVILQAKKALYAIGVVFDHEFVFEDALIGAIAIEKTGNPLPEQTLNLCLNTDAILFGAVTNCKHDTNSDLRPIQGLLKLRQALGLYANIRPIKPYNDLLDLSPLKRKIIEGADFIIFRELSGGSYYGEKKINEQGTLASDLCEYSEDQIIRISHLAFRAAQNRSKKVTLVDKANVLEVTELWKQTVTAMKEAEYPNINLSHMYVDNAAMQLVRAPKQFDVIVTSNLFGDILSDEAAMLTGSIGMLPSASLDENGKGMYEPCHGSAPDIAGQNLANPLATILSVAMMLRYTFREEEAAKAIEDAVGNVLDQGLRTADIMSEGMGKVGTAEMGQAVVAALN